MMRAQAVLLAGGAGSRLGGLEKALLKREGRTLIAHWTDALLEREIPGVVVGSEHLRGHIPGQILLTREDPPLSGPAAAVCAGVRALIQSSPAQPAEVFLLLSVDTVDPGPLLDWLLDWLPALHDTGEDAVVPRDQGGQFQMLSSAVDRAWLSRRVAQLAPGEETGRSLRWLIGAAPTAHPLLPEGLGQDVDTTDDARHLGVALPAEPPTDKT